MENSKIIICLDGTGNDPEDAVQNIGKDGKPEDDSISNVLKLHLLAGGKLDNSQVNPRQQTYYYSGVGTRGSIFRRTLSSLFAKTEPEQIQNEAYNDLCNAYKKGDEIFIFGFSRGAAIARMLACKIEKKGVNGYTPKIKLLGVWDTVAAMGKPNLDDNTRPISDVLFENDTISGAVENAVHLVSIDETRKAYRPTLMNVSDRVEEIWFAGVHSDIGGGYNLDGLSDITLEFMMRRISQFGINFIQPGNIDYKHLGGDEDEVIELSDVAIKPDLFTKIHEHIRNAVLTKLTLAPREICKVVDDKPSSDHLPIIHHSVMERCKAISTYRPEKLGGLCHYVMDENDYLKEYGGLKDYDL